MSGHQQQQQRMLSQVAGTDLILSPPGAGELLPVPGMTEVHTWKPSHVGVWFLMTVFGVIFVVVLTVGLIRGWQTVLVVSPYVALGCIGLVVAGVLFSLYDHARHHGKMKRLHEESAALDVQAKREAIRQADEKHTTEQYLATWRLPADELGNRPFPFNPHTGVYLPIPSGNFLQPVPHTLHWDYRDTSTKVKEEPQPGASLPPPVPSGRQLLEDGTVEQALAKGYYLLGPSDDGNMKQIACKRLFSTIVAGIPRVGKTTTVFWIVVQVLIALGKFFVVDPNMFYESEDGDRGLASILSELARFMVFPPCEGKRSELRVRLIFMYHALKERKQPGYVIKKSDTILFVMDEFNTCANRMDTDEIVVTDEEEGDLTLLGLLALLEREGPKYGLVFLLIGHKWSRQDIGDNAIRTNATTYLCHKMNDEGQAKLLMSGSHAKKVLELPVGAYLASGPQFEQNATKIYTPMISARDIPVILEVITRVGGQKTVSGTTHTSLPEPFPTSSEAVPGDRPKLSNGTQVRQDGKPQELDVAKLALLRQMVLENKSQSETIEAIFPGMRKSEAMVAYRTYLAALVA